MLTIRLNREQALSLARAIEQRERENDKRSEMLCIIISAEEYDYAAYVAFETETRIEEKIEL